MFLFFLLTKTIIGIIPEASSKEIDACNGKKCLGHRLPPNPYDAKDKPKK